MSKEQEQLNYLEDERKKLWIEVDSLTKSALRVTSEDQKEIANARRKTSEHRNKAEKAHTEAVDFTNKIKQLSQELFSDHEIQISRTEEVNALLVKLKSIDQKYSGLDEKVEALDILVTQAEALTNRAEVLEDVMDDVDERAEKIKAIFSDSSNIHVSINKVYREIFGYKDKDEDGDEIQIDGLRSKLEKSFEELSDRINGSTDDLEKSESDYNNARDKYLNENDQKVTDKIEFWGEQCEHIKEKILSHLPGAMTAGLSSEFAKKRIKEQRAGFFSNVMFILSLLLLVLVSLIPFCSSYYLFLTQGKLFQDIITDLPTMTVSLIPLYMPLLWMAYSSSKKVNLSKRLVEEYSHKEVMSGTIEGLSKKIAEVDDDDISADLRVKLLYNMLEVSAENPGKLISDYQKADHPLLDALDKSSKLTRAVEGLAKIPGFTKLAGILEQKNDELLRSSNKAAEDGLGTVNSKAKI